MIENVKFRMALESGNQAMVDYPREAVAKILRDAADKVERLDDDYCYDQNGNKVGVWFFQAEDEEEEETDPENIYGSETMQQSIEEDRK